MPIRTESESARTYFTVPDMVERLQIGRTTLFRAVATGKIPKPVKIGLRITRWPVKTILTWEADGCPAGESGK